MLHPSQIISMDMKEILDQFLAQGMPFDDIIIGTIGMVDPLLAPSGICDVECVRYLKGITKEDVARLRKEILSTTDQDRKALLPVMEAYVKEGKFCAVGDKGMTDAIGQA